MTEPNATPTPADVLREFFGARAQRLTAPMETAYFPSEIAAAGEIARLRGQIAAVEVECFKVCRDNTREALGDDMDPEDARFVCLNEDGMPIIEAETPAEVVRALDGLWSRVSEHGDKLEDENRRLRAHRDAMIRRVERLETFGVLPSAGFGRAFVGVDRDAVLAALRDGGTDGQ